jgi:carbon-monoxide dehydrogenase medium subunit
MKPAPFDYQAPDTLREAIDLLASNPEALVIAGGQSLMPVLAFRLATPSLLVDLRRLPGLGNIAVGDNGLSLGALVRWRDIEDDQRLVSAHPLLHAAVAYIAHYQIRNRGTVGGSLAHADPAAELPGVAVTCQGEITLFGPVGSRTVRAEPSSHLVRCRNRHRRYFVREIVELEGMEAIDCAVVLVGIDDDVHRSGRRVDDRRGIDPDMCGVC